MIRQKRLPEPNARILVFSLMIFAFCVIFIFGCEEQSMQADIKKSSFGLSNAFSGRPNLYQRRNLPQTMRGAYYIEPVRNISRADFKEIMKKKQLVAEEINDGQYYVAMRESRIVQLDTFAAGLMIYIERYRIVDN